MPLSKEGYTKRTASEIKEDIVNSLRQTIPEFVEQDADLINNLIDTSIEAILQYENLMNTLFNSYAPDFANDDIFLKFAESVGVRAKNEFQAQATITFKGKYGDFIPRNTIITDANGLCEFKTQENVVCDSTGTANVLALSETEDVWEVGTLNTIKTILGGDITATNQVASLKYIPAEDTASVKARAQAKFRSVRQGGKLYAEQLLKGVDGVDRRLVAFYDTTISYNEGTEQNPVYYYVKGIEAVVGGGADEDVAKALYLSFLETQKLISNPSDDKANRRKSMTLYIYNNPVTIEFTRPKVRELYLTAKISFNDVNTSPTAIQYLTQAAVTEYVNNLKVGIQINAYSLIEVIMPLIIANGMPAYTIKDISFEYKIGESGAYQAFNSDKAIPTEKDHYYILNGYGVEINTNTTTDAP